MEPCWGRGQGRLAVFETETETEIEAETEEGGGSQKEGMTWSQRSEGLGCTDDSAHRLVVLGVLEETVRP